MKPVKQRIAIAETCPELGWWKDHEGGWHFKNGAKMRNGDPLQDLNAMHEAEAVVWADAALWKTYSQELGLLCDSLAPALHATAAQRAEAFLRTIGKWTEE